MFPALPLPLPLPLPRQPPFLFLPQEQPLTLHHREHGNKVIGEVTLDQVYGGARGIKSLVWEVRTPHR
jgi:hypothetical protein